MKMDLPAMFSFRCSFNSRVIIILAIVIILNILNIMLYYTNFNFKQFVKRPNAKCLNQYGYIFDYKSTLLKQDLRLIKPGTEIMTFDKQLYNSHTWLERPISSKVKEQMMNLLEHFLNLLTSHNISFVMSQGMLLGSYLFHDLIPWDDDLDIFIDLKDIAKLRGVFRKSEFQKYYGVHSFHEVDDINMYSKENLKLDITEDNAHLCGKGADPDKKCYQTGKIYNLNSPSAGNTEWGYPFIDFFFVKNNGTHVRNFESLKYANPIINKVEDYYPFVQRPFNRFWIPAPKNSRKFLTNHYKEFKCMQSSWDHVNERVMYIHNMFAQKAPCDILKDCYPFVQRRLIYDQHQNIFVRGKVIEDLIFGNTTLRSVIVNDKFKHKDVLSF